ncbi:hypothetical protein [Polaribacter porphyrae]|uniref:Uncharacterized protein n=1 Tax=Polaribacter porphyrae TaxID=1137780 RepID=A0A2S7WSZ6_9FLAO|nr:hypothetical protein [Polaribacter porphyrae]PQJ80576.1 hypothetical protein BTO18_15940 [Polaribacter porphyrae]
MTHLEEMVFTFLNEDSVNLSKEIHENIRHISSFEKFGMDFRLIKMTDENINFEIICLDKNLGFIYTKPIGIYHSNGEFTILKEFEESYHKLLENELISRNKKVNFLTLTENAIIASFSVEAIFYAMKMEDVTFSSNGLDMEIWLTNEGDSQSFLDDKYEFKGSIAGYDFRNGKENVWSVLKYKEIYDSLLKMKLLTIFNTVRK